MSQVHLIFLLLILFQTKHLLADFFWQTEWMLGKFKNGLEWILPLAGHCAVHAICTFSIIYILFKGHGLYWLAAADFIVHFIMDRIKASPNLLGRFKALSQQEYKFMSQAKNNEYATRLNSNKWYYRSLGIDQYVHHLTHYWIIYCLVLSM